MATRTSTEWIQSSPKPKRSKIFLYGPPGSYKTRTMLRLGEPNIAVIDTEFGTQHYGDFDFVYRETVDPDEVIKLVKSLIKNPGKIETIGLDTFSVYYEALVSKYSDLFLKREIRSAGHKGEYYTLQPRDYQPINREASKLVRLLMQCDLNVIVTCQVKDLWGDNMKVVGTIHDGWKRLPYYFDTPIEIKAHKNTFQAVCSKDRSHRLEVGKIYPWGSDEEAYNLLSGVFGKDPVDKITKTSKISRPKSELNSEQKSHKQKQKDEPKDEPKEEQKEQKKESISEPNKQINPETLLMQIVKLKRELHIVDRNAWNDLLKPYEVQTAKDMSIKQLLNFIKQLESMRPTPAPGD